jgi:hypothetical protein
MIIKYLSKRERDNDFVGGEKIEGIGPKFTEYCLALPTKDKAISNWIKENGILNDCGEIWFGETYKIGFYYTFIITNPSAEKAMLKKHELMEGNGIPSCDNGNGDAVDAYMEEWEDVDF